MVSQVFDTNPQAHRSYHPHQPTVPTKRTNSHPLPFNPPTPLSRARLDHPDPGELFELAGWKVY